jgi:hypothetical protein
MSDNFWKSIATQLTLLKAAHTAQDVVTILNAYGPPSSGDAFFAGSGGDGTVWDSLYEAGWTLIWSEASYYWAMRAPDGSKITYVEGDIYKFDDPVMGTES